MNCVHCSPLVKLEVIYIVSITLSVSAELKKEMDLFPELNWSAVAREAIKRKIMLLRKFREFTKDSEFTEEDALRLGREASKGLSKKYKKKR